MSGTRRSRPSSSSSTSSGARSTTTSPSGCSPIRRSSTTHQVLRSQRRYKPHQLSEPEEKISAEKSLTGVSAWGRLFNELVSDLSVSLDGADLSLDEALAKLARETSQEERGRVADAVTEALRPGVRTRGYVLNTILNERAIEDRLRDYDTWISARNLANEIPDEAAQSLVDAIQARYDIPQRFYALKARLLGLERLKDYDRFAPLQEVGGTIAWDEAREIVLGAFNDFSPQAGGIIGDFFEKDWIDAALRPGKMLGAFCATTVPGVHPYVLMNYAGERRSVLTLAHELGHGLHGVARPGPRAAERAHAADARRDGVRLRRGAHLREAEGAGGRSACAARPARRPDRRHRRHRLPPDRDEPFRARDPHRPARGGRAHGRAHLRALERRSSAACSATRSR